VQALERHLVKRVVAAAISWMILVPPGLGSAGQLFLRDLDGRLVEPLRPDTSVKATVIIFTSSECPISNRYAPAIRQLHDRFAAQGVAFWMVYPDPGETPDAIRAHLKAYDSPARALRDPGHALVHAAGATVTPEAALFDASGRLAYHGRIDDRYVNVALSRPAPRTRDLEEAVAAVLHGRVPREAATQAVGCFIADLDR
jgi:hypothetical protein